LRQRREQVVSDGLGAGVMPSGGEFMAKLEDSCLDLQADLMRAGAGPSGPGLEGRITAVA